MYFGYGAGAGDDVSTVGVMSDIGGAAVAVGGAVVVVIIGRRVEEEEGGGGGGGEELSASTTEGTGGPDGGLGACNPVLICLSEDREESGG